MIATQNGRAWTIFTVIDFSSSDSVLGAVALPERQARTILQRPARYIPSGKVERTALRLAQEHRGCTVYIHQRAHRDRGDWKLQGSWSIIPSRNDSPRKK